MKTIDIEDITYETIVDPYTVCKYLERKGHSLEDITQGNVHDKIEEITEDNWLNITQVVEGNLIEGYLIGGEN